MLTIMKETNPQAKVSRHHRLKLTAQVARPQRLRRNRVTHSLSSGQREILRRIVTGRSAQ